VCVDADVKSVYLTPRNLKIELRMSRLKGIGAAGLQILKNKKPAFLTKHSHMSRQLLADATVVIVTVCFLVGGSVASTAIPVPPKKPDVIMAALTQVPSSRLTTPEMEVGPYKSPYAGEEMDLYRDIFRYQAAGKMDETQRMISAVKDDSLMGHVLAQRYLSPSYKSNFDELKNWLDKYADLPQADRIRKLANARAPKDFKGKLKDVSYTPGKIEALEDRQMLAKAYTPKIKRSSTQNSEAASMISTIKKQIQIYEPTAALRTLTESRASAYLDDVEKDRLKAIVASGYFYANNLEKAASLSEQAMHRSRSLAPMAGWINGLVHYRQGNYGRAASSFEMAAHSPYATGTLIAASSFWSARSYEKAGSKRKAASLLERASSYPRTFYGLLATQSLNKDADLNWDAPNLTKSKEKEILATPAGQRAEKLIAAGEVGLAEEEIRALYIRGNHERKKDLMAYAHSRKMPSLTMKLAYAMRATDEETIDSALYPAMPWQPANGYRIDRALLHAIARQESHFNALAENKGSGATGLMQLMPTTATYIAGHNEYDGSQGKVLLKTPEVSLALGQKYVEHLLNSSLVGQDLLSLAIAYNAGPGRLQKWKAERPDINDPLLFIESIPYAETRTYVERVMSNYWIYRMRFDQSTESMKAVAQGNWARYASQDKGAVKFAEAR
jgi:soluble lytic murein transglycosylase